MFNKKPDNPESGFSLKQSLKKADRPVFAVALLWFFFLIVLAVYSKKPDRAFLQAMAMAGIWAGLALGLNIVVGFAGLLDLGFIAFFGIGAYTTAIISTHVPESWWLIWVLLPVCGGVSAVFGVLLGAPTLRLRGDYLAIVTLGFGEIIRLVFTNWKGLTNGAKGITNIPHPSIGSFQLAKDFYLAGVKVPHEMVYALLVLVSVTILHHVAESVSRTRIGRAWMAIRDNELAASSLGIQPTSAKLVAFGAGASFAGVCGAFFATIQGFVDPNSFVFFESALVLAMVVMGGMGSSIGAMVGALVLVIVPFYFQELRLAGHVFQTSEYRMLLLGAAMVTLMALKPSGLIGKKGA